MTRLSILLGVLGIIGIGAVAPYLKRRLSHPTSYHYWLLGVSALFPAWLIAFVSLLPSSTAGADRIPLPRPALFSSAAVFFGIILTDYVLRRMNRAGRVYKPVTYWLLGIAALLPGWCLALLLWALHVSVEDPDGEPILPGHSSRLPNPVEMWLNGRGIERKARDKMEKGNENVKASVEPSELIGRRSFLARGVLRGAIALTGIHWGWVFAGEMRAYKLAPESVLPADIRQARAEIREAYRFAIANRDTLRYIPCYCGCGSEGHTSNASCYVKDYSTPERIIFDRMSLNWGICINITRDVMRMLDEGKALKRIRANIDQKYSKYGPPTPTPPVP